MEAGIPNARLRVGEKMLEAAALDLGASALDKAWAEADAQLPAVTPEVGSGVGEPFLVPRRPSRIHAPPRSTRC